MKKLLLHILLLSYTVVMVKPVLPYISDFAAHTFFYAQHMATVHYQNGKFHVHREIIDNAKKNDPAKENHSSKKEDSVNDHISLLQKNKQPYFHEINNYCISYSSSLASIYLQADYPPPRV